MFKEILILSLVFVIQVKLIKCQTCKTLCPTGKIKFWDLLNPWPYGHMLYIDFSNCKSYGNMATCFSYNFRTAYDMAI